jgi:hypothetical protein
VQEVDVKITIDITIAMTAILLMMIVIDIPQVTDLRKMTDVCILILDDYKNEKHRQRTYKTEKSHSSLAYILIFLVVIGVIGCCICAGGLFFWLTKRCRSDAGFDKVPTTETNTAQETTKAVSIPIEETEANDANLFPSGVWSGRYFQYDQWHGPSNFSLSFDPSSFTIDGSGSDDIGAFNLTGRYSTTTKEIELVKKYQHGTGDESENFGHNVTIEVNWDNDKQLFLGNWYVNTDSYRDEDQYELQFRNPF